MNMGQTLIVLAVSTLAEIIQLVGECYQTIHIPKHVVKATIDETFWRGVIHEMFKDDVYTPDRVKVVEKYTHSVCRHLQKHEKHDIADAIRFSHQEWLESIKGRLP